MLAAEFPGLTPKQIGMTIAGLVVLEIFIIFYFGFMRGAWTFLFFLMCSGAIAPAYRTFRRSGPRAAAEQFGGFINKKIARFTFARGMPPLIAAALPIVLFAVVFAFVLGPSSASSGASASATASRAGLSSADIESFYSLGYEDAQLNRPFGTSLPSSSSEADFDDAPPRPPAGPVPLLRPLLDFQRSSCFAWSASKRPRQATWRADGTPNWHLLMSRRCPRGARL